MNDYELLYYYRLNPTATFVVLEDEFRNLIYSAIHQVCFNFKKVCFTIEDLYQEGLLAMMNALEGYRVNSEATFSSYLFRCVLSSSRLVMRKHRSLSFGLLDRSYSLSFPLSIDESITLIDVIAEEKVWYQPEQMAYFEELYDDVMLIINSLTNQERQIFELRNSGYSYQRIADVLGLSTKKVDNVLQKMRRLVKA
ncbi:MAG TPA: sigma-70 family RNA polymerase sigma factor [Erysipelothrix sp.]|jgi:RNA polymerase sporulation-specific sigma factor|nr:sigma-70 family RNA polymerase sigma factor [Erysipelothrix sp.]